MVGTKVRATTQFILQGTPPETQLSAMVMAGSEQKEGLLLTTMAEDTGTVGEAREFREGKGGQRRDSLRTPKLLRSSSNPYGDWERFQILCFSDTFSI
jgi:hypothetical protein